MNDQNIPEGERRLIDGVWRVHYDGYWIRAYDLPKDTLLEKKRLIEALTRRLFNHVEHGLNVPGSRLDEARQSYEAEIDPAKKRVKGAMLAGALFNRAADIFTKLVDVQALGVAVTADNPLMRECGRHLQEALDLGRTVLHRSGEECIDELWGEPFKAFAYPVEAYYRSRYIKIAQTMRAIDRIGEELVRTLGDLPAFQGITARIREFTHTAKIKAETLRSDDDIFDVWSNFVVAGERLLHFEPALSAEANVLERQQAVLATHLIRQGKDLILAIARARVPMPKSTQEFLDRCEAYRNTSGPFQTTSFERPLLVQ